LGFGLLPDLVAADGFLRPRGEGDLVVKIERLQYVVDHRHDVVDLRFDLFGPDEQVAVVDGERPDAGEPGEFAALLLAIDFAVFGVADGQIAVRPGVLLEDRRVAGAVHRFEAVLLVVDIEQEHIVNVVVVMPRLLPEFRSEEMRRLDVLVAVLVVHRLAVCL